MTSVDVAGCIACDLAAGRVPLPGGLIHESESWRVEHCVGPLGLGTLVVKPKRHVEHVSKLTPTEAEEMGPLLTLACAVVTQLCVPTQVYVCLWSHGPVHIHFVVQPVTDELMDRVGSHGPKLQAEMFDVGQLPDAAEVASFADAARTEFAKT